MLAVSSTGTLTLLDPALLKRPPSSVSPCISLINSASSSAWSHDNNTLFLASSKTIHEYEPSSNLLKDTYTSTDEEKISNLLCTKRRTLIYSVTNKVILLEYGSDTKIGQIIDTPMPSIKLLSVSNDYSFLAVISCDAVHVYNLMLGSHVVLKGLALGGHHITASAFHPHTPTKLFLVAGRKLVIYDITRLSGPVKTIPLNQTALGDAVAIVCSPFSKTLVAVVKSGGAVELIDLDKEKGSFRVVNLKASLTSASFSAEGATLYLGTENGKLFILDLRALDKPPKTFNISETGCRIETMSVQKKISIKQSGSQSTSIASSRIKPVTEHDFNLSSKQALAITPPKPVAIPRSTHSGSMTSPIRHLSNKSTPTKLSHKTEKKVLSPARDPLRNGTSNTLDARGTVRKIATPMRAGQKSSILSSRSRLSYSPNVSISPKSISSKSKASRISSSEAVERPGRVSAVLSSRKTTSPNAATSTTRSQPTVPIKNLPLRSRAASSASRTNEDVPYASTTPPTSNPSSSVLRSVPPKIVPSSIPLPTSRTPSPTSQESNPITPVLKKKLSSQTSASVMGPGRGKQAFPPSNDKGKVDRKGKTTRFEDEDVNEGSEEAHERSMTMQVSPLRPPTSWEASPLRQSLHSTSADGNSPHDLLRSIVKDAMYDFQQETRAEMMGLHLDLLRMGRGWKQEVKALMQEYAGTVDGLREENRKLREENERLKGY